MNETTVIDLRSDTVTKPSVEMRSAMAEAEVGDDVFGGDPTVNRLQETVAELLGKEAAILVTSGTMANQTAIRVHTRPGDEIIAHADSHIYHYEGGGPAALSGCSMRLLSGDRGQFGAADVRVAIRGDDSHNPRSALVVVENTHNRGGGSVWPVERLAGIQKVAKEHGLAMHLDGARLMNACVASGRAPVDFTRYFDTVSLCFSKGLGAPMGSIVAGSADTIRRVHRVRKMLGGGMRQAGILAAGALFAIEHNVDRLAEDHENAKRLARGLSALSGLSVDLESVETNLVYVDVEETLGTAHVVRDALHARGVWTLALAPRRFRVVTHLDVSAEDIDRAIAIAAEVVGLELAA